MDTERQRLIDELERKIGAFDSETDLLRTAAEVLDEFSDGYNWTGFYLMRGDHLEVGPYVGPETPHVRIELNSGICGAAASRGETINVPDVSADPRFLACSISTRSELVVPLMDGDTCIGEIDIDSDTPAFFTDQDRLMVEAVAEMIVARLRQLR